MAFTDQSGVFIYKLLLTFQLMDQMAENDLMMIQKDGSVALTANWDAGSYEIRSQTFQSDIATGTAPFTVASTTVVTNLNADSVDGVHDGEFTPGDNTVTPSKLVYESDDFHDIGSVLHRKYKYTIGDGGIDNNSAEQLSTVATTTYEKLKETVLPSGLPAGTTLRIKFDIHRTPSVGTVYGKVYRNGSPVGTEQSTVSDTYVQKTEDISGWSQGDLLQIYGKTSGSGQSFIEDLLVTGTFEDSATVFTHQDP